MTDATRAQNQPKPLDAAGDTSSWILPALSVLIVAGVFIYTRVATLDSIEARALQVDRVLQLFGEHIALVVVSTLAVILIGLPLGILLSRPRFSRLQGPFLAVANAGQAIPSIGILVLLALLFGVGFWMAVISLVAYAVLPILRNTLVGLKQVDRSVIDAARGMGMSNRERLFQVELPLAVPIILAGVRIALILNVGVATLATYTDAGGLGDLIEAGIVLNRVPILLSGSLLTIALCFLVDWLASIAEVKLAPRGL